MSTPAFQLRPIGQTTPVTPYGQGGPAPGQAVAPQPPAGMPQPGQAPYAQAGQPQGRAFSQSPQLGAGVQPVQNQTQDQVAALAQSQGLTRPQALERMIEYQNAQTNPQQVAEQANNQRLEQMMAESIQRANEQNAQLGQAFSAMSQAQQQQADFQRQQLELQQQQMAAAAQAGQRQPWEDPSLELDADTRATFEESLPVIDKVARRNALQAAHEVTRQTMDPALQAMQQQIEQLGQRVQSNTQIAQQTFRDQLLDAAEGASINLETIESDPDFVAFTNETSNPYSRTRIRDDLNAAIASGQTKDIRVIREIFSNYAQRRDESLQGGGNALPPQGGGARTATSNAAVQSGEADVVDNVNSQYQELETYRSQLLDGLKRQQIDIGTFQTEIAKVEDAVNALISQTQTT